MTDTFAVPSTRAATPPSTPPGPPPSTPPGPPPSTPPGPPERRPVGRTGRELGVERLRTAERWIAAAVLLALGVRYLLPRGASSGLVLALLTSPMWLASLSRYRWARLYVGAGALTVLWALSLTAYASLDHRISSHNVYGTTFLLLEMALGVGVAVWARGLMPAWQVGTAYAVGLLVHAKLYPGVLGATNPLKFNWLVPLAVLVLSLVYGAGRWVQTAAVGVLAVAAGLSDSRAVFGTALVAFVMLAWQLRPTHSTRRVSWAWTGALLAGLGFAIYQLSTILLINGYLGSAAQQRSVDQVEQSGSLLLGGRPELSATWGLLTHYPGGFGAGVIANYEQINVAKTAMLSINYDPDNGYVDRYMFGASVELHSTIGDLWAAAGVAGLAMAALVLFIVVQGVSTLVANRTGTALVVFFSAWTIWNLLFSPLQSAVPTLLITVAMIIAESPRSARLRAATDDDPTRKA